MAFPARFGLTQNYPAVKLANALRFGGDDAKIDTEGPQKPFSVAGLLFGCRNVDAVGHGWRLHIRAPVTK